MVTKTCCKIFVLLEPNLHMKVIKTDKQLKQTFEFNVRCMVVFFEVLFPIQQIRKLYIFLNKSYYI